MNAASITINQLLSLEGCVMVLTRSDAGTGFWTCVLSEMILLLSLTDIQGGTLGRVSVQMLITVSALVISGRRIDHSSGCCDALQPFLTMDGCILTVLPGEGSSLVLMNV